MTFDSLVSLWPAAGVRARARNLELRWVDDELAVELASLAARGIHDPERMPFNFPWTRGSAQEVARNVLTYQWRTRQDVGAGRLTLEYAVLVDGTVVGVQGASGASWPILRSVETGSWLGREFHGRGIGTRMRAVLLHLLFDGLDAAEVTSTAFEDNPASNAVSLKTGYLLDGTARVVREGVATSQNRYRMTRERWEEVRDVNTRLAGGAVALDGVTELRDHLDAPVN